MVDSVNISKTASSISLSADCFMVMRIARSSWCRADSPLIGACRGDSLPKPNRRLLRFVAKVASSPRVLLSSTLPTESRHSSPFCSSSVPALATSPLILSPRALSPAVSLLSLVCRSRASSSFSCSCSALAKVGITPRVLLMQTSAAIPRLAILARACVSSPLPKSPERPPFPPRPPPALGTRAM